MRVPVGILVLAVVVVNCSENRAYKPTLMNFIRGFIPEKAISTLGGTARGLSPDNLKRKVIGELVRQGASRSGAVAEHETSVPAPADMVVLTYGEKRNRLRQDLVRETEDNCLAKILCGVRPTGNAKPTNKDKDPSLTADTAYLVKEFFNIFDFTEDEKKPSKSPTTAAPKEEEEEEQDDDDEEDEEIFRKAPVTGSTTTTSTTTTSRPQRRKSPKPVATTTTTTATTAKTTTTERTTPSPEYEVEEVQSVSTPSFVLDVKTDRNDDDDEEDDNHKYDEEDDDDSKYHRVTLEELVGDIKLTAQDFAMMRRGRALKLDLDTVTPSKFIQSKLRQMKMADSDAKKLRIAGQVASSFRQPRQCRQFHEVAEKVLQTCPLTTEVIRFFNQNLKNNTQIEIKQVPPGTNYTAGGLVILNNDVDAHHAYFVDNSPQVANTRVQTDLKNPSVPTSANEDETQHVVYEKRPNPKPQNQHLNQQNVDVRKRPTEAPPPSEEDSEEDDEEGDSSDEDDDEDEDEEEDDEEVSTYRSTRRPKQQVEEIQGSNTNQPNKNVVIRPKFPKYPPPAPPTLPPGIIRVYGVPQPSFDKDFSMIADQLGGKPLANFGEEDIDRPAYKRRRQMTWKSDDDDDNHAYSSRVPKHPPLETVSSDDDDDDDNKVAYSNKKKQQINTSGVPLGGLKEDDDDDDDDDDSKKSSKYGDKGANPHGGQGYGGQGYGGNQPYYQQNYYRPAPPRYRPIVRPIQIIPDASIRIGGMGFQPSPGREYMRPGRLYPIYGK